MNTSRFKRTLKVLTVLICMTVLFFQNTILVFAAAPAAYGTAKTFTLEDFGQTSDDTYQGVLVSRDYGITLPAAWEYSSAAVLKLKFGHSPSLNEKSTIAVDWNDVRLSSAILTVDNIDGGLLEIEIPAQDLVHGYNTLHVEFYMGISDDFCSDVDNPAVWAVVHKATSLTLYPRAASPDLDLSILPLPLIDSSYLVDNQVTLLVPKDPGAGELNALAAVSAKLGALSEGWMPLDVEVMTIQDALSDEPKGNLILIAAADALRQFSTRLIMDDKQSGTGQLIEQVSPFDNTAVVLAVTGKDQADVEKSGWALTDSSLFPRLSGSSAVILDLPQRNGSQSNGSAYTLAELGYTDTAVYGSREQEISFDIPLKALWQENTTATLDLHFIHSSLLKNDRFTLTVGVNGLPVGSVVISGGDSSDQHKTFQLPLRFFETGVNYLTIQSSIQLSDDYSNNANYCTDEQYNRAWLTVASDSQVVFPSAPDQVTSNLANFPYTFIGSNDLSQLAFVLADAPEIEDIQVLSALAVRIGQIVGSSSLWPQVLTADQAAQQEADYPYQILVGLPLKNKAIIDAGDMLPQPFDADSGKALAVAELSTLDTSKIGTGYIQVFMTENNVPRLVVTGNTSQGLLLAADQLTDAAKSVLLEGDLAITTSADQAVSLWVSSDAEEGTTVSPVVQKEQTLTVWFQPGGVTYAALAVLLVTLLIIIIRVVITLKNDRSDG